MLIERKKKSVSEDSTENEGSYGCEPNKVIHFFLSLISFVFFLSFSSLLSSFSLSSCRALAGSLSYWKCTEILCHQRCFRILGMLSFETLNTDFWYLYKASNGILKAIFASSNSLVSFKRGEKETKPLQTGPMYILQ